MKRRLSIGIALSLSAIGMSLFAALNTSLETDFLQLREKRDKALAVVSEPINDGYRASLEQLLKRAIEEKDKDTAAKIQLELQFLAKGTTASSPEKASAVTTEMAALRTQLIDTKWRINQDKTFTLHANGSSTSSWTQRKGHWKVIDATTVELDIGNIPRRENVVASQGATLLAWAKREADELHPQVAKKIVPIPEE